MSVIERSEEEEPVSKKIKLIDDIENCCEVPMLSRNETVVDDNNGSCRNDICVGLESDDRKIEGVSSLSLVDGKHIDTKESEYTEIEEKEIEVVLGDANIEKVPVLELENNNEASQTSPVTSSDEVSVIVNKDSCDGLGGIKEEISINVKEIQDTEIQEKENEVVLGDANIEKVPVLELENNNEASVILAVTSSDEVSVIVNKDSGLGGMKEKIRVNSTESQDTEIEEKKVEVVSGDTNIKKVPVLELEKNNEASITLAVTSSDEVSGIVNKDSCDGLVGMKEEIRVNASVLRKKLLVLDLNGLLADIVSPLPDCEADINIGRRAIFKRPFCEDFLKFCFDKFEVGIWSSRKWNNVVRITEFLLGDMMKKLLFCWDMSYCAMTTVASLENRHKYIVFKDINRLWEKHDPQLPWQKGYYNETNTVLLDDSPYKALLNPPYTAIFPHSYNHQNKTDTSLGNGGDLRLHLEKLVEAENVQDFIKENPFGQEAITESSQSWEFYRDAIRMLHLSSQTYRFTNFIR